MNRIQGRPTDRTPSDFGNFLLAQLQLHGQTQTWLAKGAKVSNACVTKWIYGEKQQITEKNLDTLSRRLKVPKEDLLKARGSREGVESRQIGAKLAKPPLTEFDRARAKRAKHDRALAVKTTTAKKPTLTKKESPVGPDGSTSRTIGVIRSLLPQLSSEQRLLVLEMILSRDSIEPDEQKRVVEYMVDMLFSPES